MTRNLLIVMALAAAACGKKKSAANDDCAAAVEHVMSVETTDASANVPADIKKQMTDMMARATPAVIKACQDTKWSAEVTSCMKSVKAAGESKKCDEKLTKEQQDAAKKAVADATSDTAPVAGVKINDVDKRAAIRDITALMDEMCACKDAACGEAVYKKWGDVEKSSELARHDEATKKQWEALDNQMMKCRSALK